MRRLKMSAIFVLSLVVVSLASSQAQAANQPPAHFFITGRLVDTQKQPVVEAEISARLTKDGSPQAQTVSQDDGSWLLQLPTIPENQLVLTVERHHYEPQMFTLDAEALSLHSGWRRSFL
jgi:hypothetical protein